MKKYLVIALAALFVLGFAASSFAIHAEIPAESQAAVATGSTQITIGGDIRIRARIMHNTSDFDSDTVTKGDNSLWDERVRLQVEAKVTPNTTGLIQLESGDSNHDTYNWGTGTASNTAQGATGTIKLGDYKPSAVNILQAWILHTGDGLLGVPALVKIGHMPIQIDGLFYSHTKFGDDALLLGVDPVKGLHIILGTVKLLESSAVANAITTVPTTTSADVNGYTGIISYAVDKDTSIGADVTYADGQNLVLGNSTSFAYTIFPNKAIDFAGGADLHLWNFAINAKTRVAGLGIKGEIDLQTGKAVGAHIVSGSADEKFGGYAGKLDFDYAIKPVTIMASAAYGSGDDFNKIVNDNSNKVKNFVTTLENVQHYTYVYEYFVPNAAGNISGGLQNTWFLNLGAKADLMKNVDAMISAYYLRAVHESLAQVTQSSSNPIGNSKAIGTEVDANINYQIDKNLKYTVEGGYLFAGNFWRGVTPIINGSAKSPDDAWVVRQIIQLSF